MKNRTLVVLGSDRDVTVESSYAELNARGFVRGETELDQWFLLINEGWRKTQLPMNDVVRDYLVTMLHRYSKHVDLFEQLSAFNYMEHVFGLRKVDAPCLNDVADMCLQSAAFFPEQSARRHEMKSYHYIVEIGVDLYRRLARESLGKDDWQSIAFQSMEKSFGQAMLVLRSTCPRFLRRDTQTAYERNGGQAIMTGKEVSKVALAIGELTPFLFEVPSSNTTHCVQ